MVILLLAGIALFLIIILAVIVFFLFRSQSSDESEDQNVRQKTKKSAKTPEPPATEATVQNGSNNATPPPKTEAPPPVVRASPSPQPIADSTGEQIRILIVDDNPGTRDNVSRLLYFEDDMEVIGQAINGREGIEMAKEMKPHIVLMDINMPDMDGITATKEMSMQTPYSQVVIMSVQSDQHYMKQAMAAGARDFQPKPFTSDELVSCLRRVYGIGIPMYRQYEAAKFTDVTQAATTEEANLEAGRRAPIIAVYSPKGGVGTSVIAANLGVAFQQELGDTVLMDGAFQFGDILVHLNTRPVRTVSDMIHEGTLEVDLLADVLLPHESGLRLLLAPPQPHLADFVTGPIIKDILKGLKKNYNAVLVDTTSHLTDRTLTVLEAADYILAITVPELPSIKSTKLFLEVAEQLNFDPNRIKVVINRFNILGGVRPEKVEQVLNLKQTYKIPYDPKLHVALSKGTAVNQHNPGAPSSQAIKGIAQHLWQTISATMPEVSAKEVA